MIIDAEMLIAITGPERCVSFVHLSDVRSAVTARHPAVKCTNIANIHSCHMMMLATVTEGESAR
jgi:hypothetical protein